jgi:ATP-dependent RNA helicase DDX54/DBP10
MLRLFEQGFEEAIHEIMHKMSESRQTVLFSATLPKMLVNFAKAGLCNPVLVRLDVDSKISPDLALAFFATRVVEKEAALLYLVQEFIEANQQTIIFVSTKHHVEYLRELLLAFNIECSYIYGSLDHTCRLINLSRFRSGVTKFLIVTDVAARGIDIPYLNNVIHYDFPDKPKLFVHRSGRAARAGQIGTAYALITPEDMPYLIDLQLFLARPFLLGNAERAATADLHRDIVYADLPQSLLMNTLDQIATQMSENATLAAAQKVSQNGFRLYLKTRTQASRESYSRAKEILEMAPTGSQALGIHPLLRGRISTEELDRVGLIDRIRNFRPSETIFEIRKMGFSTKKSPGDAVMKSRRNIVDEVIVKTRQSKKLKSIDHTEVIHTLEDADEEMLDVAFNRKRKHVEEGKTETKEFRDEDYYIPHVQKDLETERGYAIDTGGVGQSFVKGAMSASLDLVGDDNDTMNAHIRSSKLVWNKNKKKYVKQTVGADNQKTIRTESGRRLPASYKTDA